MFSDKELLAVWANTANCPIVSYYKYLLDSRCYLLCNLNSMEGNTIDNNEHSLKD